MRRTLSRDTCFHFRVFVKFIRYNYILQISLFFPPFFFFVFFSSLQSIERQMKLKCRCHGPSSSCSLKTCWETMPDMKKIGDFIKDKYERSIQVTYKKKKGKLKPKVRLGRGSIKRDTMVFIHRSPNFCSYNPEHGALGTRGRECNRTDYYGPKSCESLCCGRGYNVQEVRTVDTKCNCQFVWCCKVNCQTCEHVREISTCK